MPLRLGWERERQGTWMGVAEHYRAAPNRQRCRKSTDKRSESMTRIKASLGLLVASALCLAAFGAANASAANVELHTCEKNSGTEAQRYSDSGCTTTQAGTGEYTWKKVTTKTATEAVEGTASSLAATVGGIKFKISCTGLNGTGEAENSGGAIVGSGITVNYTGCEVTEPAAKGCTVSSTLSTETLKSSSNLMTIKYEPTGTKFITIAVSGCSSAVLNGNKEVTGSAVAEVPEMGKTQSFTATSGSALKYAGQTATFISANGLKMTGGGAALGAVTP
jgi:hypothetical protein